MRRVLPLLLAALAARGVAQEGATVVDVVVEGNVVHGAEAIRLGLGTRAGRPFDAKTLEADLRFLWEKMRVRAEAFEERVPGGIRVHLRVHEIPVFKEVVFRGNRAFPAAKLREKGGAPEGVALDEVTAAKVRAEVERFYRGEGYRFAEASIRPEPEQGRLVLEVSEGPLVRVREIRVVGNRAFPASTFLGLGKNLRGQMELRGRFFLFRGKEFKETTLLEDLVALRRFYRREGYREAVVELRDIDSSDDRTEVTVTLFVDEGPLYVVESVAIEGNRAIATEELEPLLTLKPGMPYTDEVVRRDAVALARYYGERGYPQHPSLSEGWEFRAPKTAYRGEESRVAVTYRIREGKKAYLREVRIVGNSQTKDPVIRRELTVHPGEAVNTTEITRSIARLDALQYFTDEAGLPSTRYRYAPTPDDAWKDLVIEVTEGKTGRVLVAGGISTVDGAFGQLVIAKNNFDLFRLPSSWADALEETLDGRAFTGGGQDLVLDLAPGTRLSRYQLRFHEPDLFGEPLERISLRTDLYRRIRRFDEHREGRQGVRAGLGRNFGKHFGVEAGVRVERIEVEQIDFDAPAIVFLQEGETSIRSVRVGAAYADVDVPLAPREGGVGSVAYEVAGGPFGGSFDFHKVETSGRAYWKLLEDVRGRAYVLSSSARFDWAGGYGDTEDVPFTERFFAGGPGSIRGFDFRGVGPVQNGDPVGGEARALFSVEGRIPLYSTTLPGRLDEADLVTGVVFLDAGALGLDLSDETFREVRVGAGVGLRVQIPFLPQIPIALDFALPVRREETDDTQVFSFSIGRF